MTKEQAEEAVQWFDAQVRIATTEATAPPDGMSAELTRAYAECARNAAERFRRAALALRAHWTMQEVIDEAREEHKLHCSGDEAAEGCGFRDRLHAALALARKEP